jgi:myxalamid-type polyketide synthase MxaB
LDDGLLFDMDLAQLDTAMAPKVQGAWNLHSATREAPLEFFVLFSSVACVLGSPGQANYAAGNAFLDGLAHYRRGLGLPAMSINWGPWAESGMAAQADLSEQMKSRGMDQISPEKGLELLRGLMHSEITNVSVMDVHWPEMLRLMPSRKPPLLRELAGKEGEPSAGAEHSKVDHQFRQRLISVDLEERKSLLRDYFVDELVRIMGIGPSDLDVEQPLNTLGLDSLMAIELKNNLETRLAFDLPMARFLESPSVATLAGHAAAAITGNGAGSPPATSTDQQETGRPLPEEQRAKLLDSTAAPASATWTPLVALHTEGTRPPLFCVHPVGGDVRCYFELARSSGIDRPVYALRARGMDGLFPPHGSMDEMVEDYIRSIRARQPHGPYHLAGWSTGGIFAYEMAYRLQQQDAAASILVFFDSPMPTIFEDVDLDDDARFLYDLVNFTNWFSRAEMSVSYRQLRSQDAEQRLQTVLDEAKRHSVVPSEVSTDHIRRLIEVCKIHVRLVMDYTPPPLEQPLHIFRPADTTTLVEASGKSQEVDLGWGRVVGEHMTLHEVPGNHFTMMTGENVRQLSELLRDCLVRTHAGLSE